jgi:hypothetical protein
MAIGFWLKKNELLSLLSVITHGHLFLGPLPAFCLAIRVQSRKKALGGDGSEPHPT